MVILENIDIDIVIDKAILPNIDIDKISNRFKFGISNRASGQLQKSDIQFHFSPVIHFQTREKTLINFKLKGF